MEDMLIIGYYDGADRGSISCLQIIRRKDSGYETINTFYEKEADDMYKKMVEHN